MAKDGPKIYIDDVAAALNEHDNPQLRVAREDNDAELLRDIRNNIDPHQGDEEAANRRANRMADARIPNDNPVRVNAAPAAQPVAEEDQPEQDIDGLFNEALAENVAAPVDGPAAPVAQPAEVDAAPEAPEAQPVVADNPAPAAPVDGPAAPVVQPAEVNAAPAAPEAQPVAADNPAPAAPEAQPVVADNPAPAAPVDEPAAPAAENVAAHQVAEEEAALREVNGQQGSPEKRRLYQEAENEKNKQEQEARKRRQEENQKETREKREKEISEQQEREALLAEGVAGSKIEAERAKEQADREQAEARLNEIKNLRLKISDYGDALQITREEATETWKQFIEAKAEALLHGNHEKTEERDNLHIIFDRSYKKFEEISKKLVDAKGSLLDLELLQEEQNGRSTKSMKDLVEAKKSRMSIENGIEISRWSLELFQFELESAQKLHDLEGVNKDNAKSYINNTLGLITHHDIKIQQHKAELVEIDFTINDAEQKLNQETADMFFARGTDWVQNNIAFIRKELNLDSSITDDEISKTMLEKFLSKITDTILQGLELKKDSKTANSIRAAGNEKFREFFTEIINDGKEELLEFFPKSANQGESTNPKKPSNHSGHNSKTSSHSSTNNNQATKDKDKNTEKSANLFSRNKLVTAFAVAGLAIGAFLAIPTTALIANAIVGAIYGAAAGLVAKALTSSKGSTENSENKSSCLLQKTPDQKVSQVEKLQARESSKSARSM